MNLGYPIEGLIPCWVIEVTVDGKVAPIAFSPEQAKEIARRIIGFYGASQAGACNASNALGGPEAL